MKSVLFAVFVSLLSVKFLKSKEQPSADFYQCSGQTDRARNSTSSIVGHYPRYNEVLEWVDKLCCYYPEIAQSYDIGKTVEGRSMIVLQLGLRRSVDAWGVWIDGGIHAREHISPATVLFIANQLIEGYRTHDAGVLEMLENINWYFLPVFNPDGYEFSHTKNRWWRKNRRRINDHCVGVDLNRNWDFQWRGADSDVDPCSDLFAGETPGSEAEVTNVVEFILPRASDIIVFLTYHSYGQRIFSRWDHSKFHTPADNEELMNLAQNVSDAIAEVSGRDYKVGTAPKMTYAFSGGSADWAKAVAGIKYSYLIELPDTGFHRFDLPEEDIIPTGMENWAGIKEISRHIVRNHGRRGRRNSTLGVGRIAQPRRYVNPMTSLFVDSRNNGASVARRNALILTLGLNLELLVKITYRLLLSPRRLTSRLKYMSVVE